MGFETILIGAAAASLGTSVIGGIQQARAAATQAQFATISAEMDMLQIEQDRDLAELQALQEEAARREEEQYVRSERMATAAALGIPIGYSESFDAIQRGDSTRLRRDIKNIRLMGAHQSFRYGLAGSAASVQRAYLSSQQRPRYGGVILSALGQAGQVGLQYALLGGGSSSSAPAYGQLGRYGSSAKLTGPTGRLGGGV